MWKYMVGGKLVNFYESFLAKGSVFSKKEVLQTNYLPESIIHRESEIQQIATTLAPILRREKPSNLFIYGNTGTGKTLSARYATSELLSVAEKQSIGSKIIYLNCKMKRTADTEYRLIAQLIRELGREIPPTGLPTEEVYKTFFKILV